MYVYVCCISLCICICLCIFIHVYVCVYVCKYLCRCIYIYMHIYIHTHIYIYIYDYIICVCVCNACVRACVCKHDTSIKSHGTVIWLHLVPSTFHPGPWLRCPTLILWVEIVLRWSGTGLLFGTWPVSLPRFFDIRWWSIYDHPTFQDSS